METEMNESESKPTVSKWLPQLIFILGSIALLYGVISGIGQMGMDPGMGAILIIGGLSVGVILWSLSYIVRAAILYIEKNK